ncbi:thiamine diphosphokinase [Sediminimonas sp.]|uniref:thiamine diphosphokinase n=1 Tax=Sediminimonas sp. TaxID=2823379 RepID=UPI0025ECBE59|nr:thiamine diphosphokinase [Sediminimonas sp.]
MGDNSRGTGVIVRSGDPIVLVGGGGIAPALWDAVTAHGGEVVAADRGAGAALARGLMPRAVIGDMDSLRASDRAALPPGIIHPIAEQETTDFEKCLRSVCAPVILGLGFGGPRMDHALANFSALVRHPYRRCLLLDGKDLVFLAPPVLRLDLVPGTRFSVFPMGPVEAESEGLQWPLDGLSLAPDGRIGTSNRVTGPVWLRASAPKLLVIVPFKALDAVIAALRALPADPWGS